MTRPMRIGILGGTFDPPHNGHLALAEAAIETLELDEVLFIPASRNPLKDRKTSHPKDRMEMTRLAISGHPKFALSDIDIARGGRSYTIDTLFELQAAKPGDYWLLLGTDALRTFDRWKSPERILQKCRLAVALRPPHTQAEILGLLPPFLAESIDWIEMTAKDISSTEIRCRIEERRPHAQWLPKPVLDYIEEKRLYR